MAVPFVPPGHPLARTADDRSITAALREQIKSNAGLLFPYGAAGSTQMAYDIVMMTVTADEHNVPSEKPKYQAVLTYNPGGSFRHGSIAARSEPQNSAVEALESLLYVTSAALEKYQGNVAKEMGKPALVSGGIIDESIVFGKTWKEVFGGKK
ncbi:hypothetical protein KC332_g13145 [Hortaea werneckii]|uniref:Uncharacterized protein n=1 Tax=Hortaea werneckii EXF-2000 TaxID=1157616 RepID=A0A1Z5TJC8_HORWE|nr:hypothetical protein KC358_g13113 [Hortaea werneckii]OTA36085.1 hypothetical protein BTJ68_03589 [Hortaea werneckii EXF-2000]KAI6809828.1 hypothetical protein KC350_g12753 [Hortaea werneckii]KAI6826421.1 hypothetical protein KC342_g10526 [Hortaea werneckii]KAI6910635.1 hypothetical protein KC348_g13158 [Hortaea werneckii]